MTVRQLMHLAAAMAHEVRNPLNSMAIHAELIEGRLKREGQVSADDREAVRRSARLTAAEIERIDKILDEYLQFAGPEEAARRAIDARALIAAAVERVGAAAAERGVRIELGAVAAVSWAIDGDAIGEAIDAVLANAVQASARGAAVEVAASTREHEDEAEIVVRDHGDGIAAAELPRIFHIGYSTRGRNGIGLTVAKQIVKGHGGSIVVTSGGAGQGTTVTIRLPLEVEA
jgi:signal transduction histidine kinase